MEDANNMIKLIEKRQNKCKVNDLIYIKFILVRKVDDVLLKRFLKSIMTK